MVCATEHQIGLLGSSFFAGWVISSTYIPNYSDRRGRKNVVFVCSVLGILVSLAIVASRSLSLTCGILFVMGVLTSGSASVGYVYMLEFFTSEWQTTFGTLDSIVGTISAMLVPLYFIYISKDYRWLFGISVIMNLVAVAGFVFFLDESPLYLYSKGEKEKADEIVRKITRFNNNWSF